MEVTGRMTILLAIFLLWFYGFSVSQHLDCPSEDWVVGSSITMKCYVPKVDFPSKCVAHPDTATIHVTSSAPTSTRCTFSDISTNTCSGSSSECSCETGNATYYILQYTFTAGTNDSGSWKCEAECFDVSQTLPQLQLTNSNCDNRDVEPTTTPPPTTKDAVVPDDDCKLFSFKSCDIPGIIIIIIIVIICIICIVYICLYLRGQKCILTCNANCHKQCGCKGCCGMIKMFHCTWVCTKKCGCVPGCSCCPQDDPERSADIPIKQFPPKTEASGAGKPITRHDPADDGKKKSKGPANETELSQLNISLSSQQSSTDEDPSSSRRPRKLPTPKAAGEQRGSVTEVGEDGTSPRAHGLHKHKQQDPDSNQAASITPRALPPLRSHAASTMPSVERNSYAETTRQPLPSIRSQDTQ